MCHVASFPWSCTYWLNITSWLLSSTDNHIQGWNILHIGFCYGQYGWPWHNSSKARSDSHMCKTKTTRASHGGIWRSSQSNSPDWHIHGILLYTYIQHVIRLNDKPVAYGGWFKWWFMHSSLQFSSDWQMTL